MNYRVFASSNFRRDAKPLLRKFASLHDELAELEKQLLTNPLLGKPLGRNCFKIRLAVKSKGKGKSGGLRVITMVVFRPKQKRDVSVVGLLSIFDKSEQENIDDKKLKALITLFKTEFGVE